MKNILISILEQSMDGKEILSFYTDKNDVLLFYVGHVKIIFSDSILLASYDEAGLSDGYILLRFVDIFKIEKGSQYLKKFLYINEDNLQMQILGDTTSKYGIEFIIDKLMTENLLSTVELIYQNHITGFIKKYDDDFLLINVYSEFGIPNGICLIKYEDIQGIAFARKEEMSILKLIETL